MNKKLPSVFANKIEKKINNNEKVYYGDSSKRDVYYEQTPIKENKLTINQKINQLFTSSTYIYKADVKITLKDKTINKRIIGRNKQNLITMDNDFIPVKDIIDIEVIKK